MKRQDKPKYKIGQTVYCNPYLGKELLIVKSFTHNGFCWMYSFEDTDMRLGESYLTSKAPASFSELNMGGSITWFKCKNKLPPILREREEDKISTYVLVTDGFELSKTFFHYSLDNKPMYWQPNNFSWVPTHWAFINLPEPS